MFDMLERELRAAGLSVNGKKTKLLTTGPEYEVDGAPLLIEAGSQMVEVVRRGESHKYLGRLLGGSLADRGQSNLEHRLSCAWLKYHSHRETLQNKRVPLHLRLRLFNSTVSPSALYSLSSTPLTACQLEKLDITQRRMLRRIVGWVRVEGEAWQLTGHRMRQGLDAALAVCPVPPWSISRNRQQDRLRVRVESGNGPLSTKLAHAWVPQGRRPQGRPQQRWTDS